MSINAPPNIQIGSINREFVTILDDLLRMIPQIIPEWTYTGQDDFGRALLELASYLADHLHYRADATLRDALPTRSPDREIVREYAEWLGYLARRVTASEADVTLYIDEVLDEDVALERGFRLSGQGEGGAQPFELSDTVVLPAGVLSVAAHVVQGVTVSELQLGLASGAPAERFRIPYQDCLFNWDDADLEVTVGGLPAGHQKFPALITPDALEYWVRQDRDGYLQVRFGDGTYGRTLPPGAAVVCTFRRGGGTAGNVGSAAIDTVVDVARLLDNTVVDLKVTNAEQASGGAPEEGLESVRAQAPAAFRSQDRAVSVEDYVDHAKRVAGIYQAKVATYGVNGVIVYVVPVGVSTGVRVTRTTRAAVTRALDRVKMATDSVSVLAADLIVVDVTLNVRATRTARNGVVREAVRRRFVDRETGIFWSTRNDLGRTLWQSDMVNEIEDIAGVNNLDVIRYCRRPVLRWLATVGNAALSDSGVATNVTTRSQTWFIEMTSSTEFIVTGSLAGLQSTFGVIDTPWADDAGEIGFTLQAGVVPVGEGDTAEIVVGELRGNIALGPSEFPIFDASSVTINVTGGIGA